MEKCLECEKNISNLAELSKHINRCHDGLLNYYKKYLQKENEGKCFICGKPTKFKNIHGYKKTCCKKCQDIYTHNQCKLGIIKKYGVENTSLIPGVREKIKEAFYNKSEEEKQEILEKRNNTNKKLYGVENTFQSEEKKEKSKQTKKERYGDENYTNLEKRKKTNKKKYGVEHGLQNAEVKEKSKQTKKERYGDENYNNTKKAKETCLKKWGVDHQWKNKEITEKSFETKRMRYNNKNYVNPKKAKETKKERYGSENYNNREKYKETNLKHFGVEYPLQNKEILEKSLKTGYMFKQFKDTTIWYQGCNELDFLEKYYFKFPNITRGLLFKYIGVDKKNHIYHSDFYIKELNLIIEIKCSWLLKRDKNIIKLKKNAVLNEGYNYIMITDKNYKDFNKKFTKNK